MKEISLEMCREEKMLTWPIFDVAKGGNKMFLLKVTTAGQEGGILHVKSSCENWGIYKEVTRHGSGAKAIT